MTSYSTNVINISLLKQYQNTFSQDKDKFNNDAYATFRSSYLNTCSDGYVSRMSSQLNSLYSVIQNSYTSINNWWSNYNSNAEGLENYLSTYYSSSLTESSLIGYVNSKLPKLKEKVFDVSTFSYFNNSNPLNNMPSNFSGFTTSTALNNIPSSFSYINSYNSLIGTPSTFSPLNSYNSLIGTPSTFSYFNSSSYSNLLSNSSKVVKVANSVNAGVVSGVVSGIKSISKNDVIIVKTTSKKEEESTWDKIVSASESVCADICCVGVSAFEGLMSFGESIGDTLSIAGTGILSVGTGIWDFGQWIGGHITGEEWESLTKKMWKGTMEHVSINYIKDEYDDFYENTEFGNWIKENAYGFDGVRAVTSGIGYVGGIIALSVATAGIGGVAVGGTAAAGGTATATTATTATLTTANAAPWIAAFGGFGKGTQDSWADGASLLEGLGYGTLNATLEGVSFWSGAKINQAKWFMPKNAMPTLTNKLLNSGSKVLADGGVGALEAFAQPVTLLYKDSYIDENGNEIKFTEDDNPIDRYVEIFDDNGGFKAVGTNVLLGLGLSSLGEIADVHSFVKINQTYKQLDAQIMQANSLTSGGSGATIKVNNIESIPSDLWNRIQNHDKINFEVDNKVLTFAEAEAIYNNKNYKVSDAVSDIVESTDDTSVDSNIESEVSTVMKDLDDEIAKANYYTGKGNFYTIDVDSLDDIPSDLWSKINDQSSVQFRVGDKIYSYADAKWRPEINTTIKNLDDQIAQASYYTGKGNFYTIDVDSLDDIPSDLWSKINDPSSVQFRVGDKIYSYADAKWRPEINTTIKNLDDEIAQANYYTGKGNFYTIDVDSLDDIPSDIWEKLDDATNVQFRVGDKIYTSLEVKELANINKISQTVDGGKLTLSNLKYTDHGITSKVKSLIESNFKKFAYKDTSLFEGLNDKIAQNGLYHFTDAVDKILDSNYIKSSDIIASYGNRKSFFFAGIPEVGAFATNLDNIPLKTTAVKVDPSASVLDSSKLKVRYLDDGAITFDGRFDLTGSNATKEYFVLALENDELVYKSVSKQIYDSYENTNTGKMLSEFLQDKKNIDAIKTDYLFNLSVKNTNAVVGNVESLISKIENIIFPSKNIKNMEVETGAKLNSSADAIDIDMEKQISLSNQDSQLKKLINLDQTKEIAEIELENNYHKYNELVSELNNIKKNNNDLYMRYKEELAKGVTLTEDMAYINQLELNIANSLVLIENLKSFVSKNEQTLKYSDFDFLIERKVNEYNKLLNISMSDEYKLYKYNFENGNEIYDNLEKNMELSFDEIKLLNDQRKLLFEIMDNDISLNEQTLKLEILTTISKVSDPVSKLRILYEELNKKLHYSMDYIVGDQVTKKLIANQEVKFSNLGKNRNVVCKGWSELYKELLVDAGFEESKIRIQNDGHFWVEVDLGNNKILLADATDAIENSIDLASSKYGASPNGFLILPSDYSGFRPKNFYNKAEYKDLINSSKDYIKDLDISLGFANNKGYFFEQMANTKKMFGDSKLLNRLFGEQKFSSKMNRLFNIDIPREMDGYEAWSYYKKLSDIILGTDAIKVQNKFLYNSTANGVESINVISYIDENSVQHYQVYSESLGKIYFDGRDKYNEFISSLDLVDRKR